VGFGEEVLEFMQLAGFATVGSLVFEEGELVVGGVEFLAQVLVVLLQL
jgi:hypothetical protein